MSYDKVKNASKRSIGTKQTMKMVEKGLASEVVVAQDADPKITEKVIALCQQNGVPIVYVDSMRQLGKACGIDVGAAMVALIKE